MSRNLSKTLITFLPLFLVVGLFADKKSNRVAVRAEATKEYTISRTRDEAAKVQTYHLIKGKYFGGNVNDPSLEEVTFEELAQELASNLKRQNYFSEENPDEGDLLIMVHYGASNFMGDIEENDVFDLDDYFPPVEKADGEVYEYQLSRDAIPKFWGLTPAGEDRNLLKEKYVRSKLLGMDDVFSADTTSYEAYVQEELAREGRYFFILTAFDLPLLKKGKKKVLWTTRYSIRTVGQDYAQALKELNHVASHYFGKNMKGLISKRATDDSLVEFGDIEVIEDTPSIFDQQDLNNLGGNSP